MRVGLLPFAQPKALPNTLSIGIAEVLGLGITLPRMPREEFNGEYFAKQLKTAMKEDGVTQAQLARDFGVKPPSVSEWISVGNIAKGRLAAIAEYFRRDLAWFLDPNYKGPPGGKRAALIAYHAEEPAPPGTYQIRESSVRFAAGSGRIQYDEIEESEPATYRLSWLRQEGINPRRSRRFKVVGDSMEPMLYSGDTVLVDTSQSTLVDGRVYAIRYGDELRIKKVSKMLDGTIILSSVNPAFKPELIPPEIAAERFQIIGRVCDKSGKGGL